MIPPAHGKLACRCPRVAIGEGASIAKHTIVAKTANGEEIELSLQDSLEIPLVFDDGEVVVQGAAWVWMGEVDRGKLVGKGGK